MADVVPYTPAELETVRPVIERYNRPESPVRRLLATLDQETMSKSASH